MDIYKSPVPDMIMMGGQNIIKPPIDCPSQFSRIRLNKNFRNKIAMPWRVGRGVGYTNWLLFSTNFQYQCIRLAFQWLPFSLKALSFVFIFQTFQSVGTDREPVCRVLTVDICMSICQLDNCQIPKIVYKIQPG